MAGPEGFEPSLLVLSQNYVANFSAGVEGIAHVPDS